MRYIIYVVGPVAGFPCKIGYASNMQRRLKSLQTCHWEDLFVHDAVMVRSKRTAMRIEKLCHKRLKDLSIRGEWFNCFSDDASKTLREIAEEIGEALKLQGNLETVWASNRV